MSIPEKNDRKKIIIEIMVVILLCASILYGLTALGTFKMPQGKHNVTFLVEASGGYAIITLKSPSQTIEEPTIKTTPWRLTTTILSGGEVYLTASNPTQTGDLTCTIYMDNSVWKTAKTSAPKDGVACAGIAP